MIRRPPISTRTDTLYPYTTLCRSLLEIAMVTGILLWRYDWPFAVATLGTIAAYIVFTLVVTEKRMVYRRSMNDLDSKANSKARSEEHTSELQSLMRISYAVFCLKKKTERQTNKKTLLHKISY